LKAQRSSAAPKGSPPLKTWSQGVIKNNTAYNFFFSKAMNSSPFCRPVTGKAVWPARPCLFFSGNGPEIAQGFQYHLGKIRVHVHPAAAVGRCAEEFHPFLIGG